MRVHIEDWVPYWRVRKGEVEVPDLEGQELLDYLTQHHVSLIEGLEAEDRGICHEAPIRTVATLPDGKLVIY